MTTDRTGYFIRTRDTSGRWTNVDIGNLSEQQLHDFMTACSHNPTLTLRWLEICLIEIKRLYDQQEAQHE